MAVVKGDTVIWRGRKSIVMGVRGSGLVLHVGEGQIVRDVGVRDYTELPDAPEPAPAPKPEPTKKPSRAKKTTSTQSKRQPKAPKKGR